jgi:predicted RecA/RadA family phage recombinase
VTTKFLQKGEVLEYSNSGSTIAANDIVVIGRRIGVALADIAATTGKGSVGLVGVYEGLPAVNNSAFAQGDNLYYNASSNKFTNVYATGLIPAGWAWAAKGETTATCTICLDPCGLLGLPPGGSNGEIMKVGSGGGYDMDWAADAVN